MAKLNSYLTFNGQTEAAFLFYQSIFGGEFQMLSRYKDMPPMEGCPPMSAEIGERVLHVSLPMGDNVLMGSDVVEAMCPLVTMGNNVSMSLHPESEAEARQWFDALSAGGKVVMPLSPMFWGALYGQLVDQFGVPWMVNYEYPKAA